MTEASELVAGLTPSQVAAIVGLGTRVRLTAGDVLFRLGDDAEWLYTIEFGRLALTLPMLLREHEREVLVEERLPGQLLGWSALIPPHRLTLTATAQSETQLLAIPREELLQLLAREPDLGYALTRSVAAVIGHRHQVLQAMWLREMQRVVELRHA